MSLPAPHEPDLSLADARRLWQDILERAKSTEGKPCT
jgi:hypothetical protein